MSSVNPNIDPMGDPGPAPGPRTIGDVIAAKKAAERDESQKKDLAAAASQAYSDAIDVNASAGGELRAGVAAIGDVYVPDESGDGIEVYIADSSTAGYHVIRPVAGTTPLPTPTPSPEPTSTPTSEPTPEPEPAPLS
jgi:hypothetical protein